MTHNTLLCTAHFTQLIYGERHASLAEVWALGCHVLGLVNVPDGFSAGAGAGGPGGAGGNSASGNLSGMGSGSGGAGAGGGSSVLGARHGSLCVQQLLLRGLLAGDTAAPSLHALAALAHSLAAQGNALHGLGLAVGSARGLSMSLQDATNTPQQGGELLGASGGRAGALSGSGVMGAQGAGAGGLSVGSWGGTFDSLRKHRLLRLDAHEALLGPWASQLFVSIGGVLPLLVMLHR